MKRFVVVISIIFFGFAAHSQNLTVEGTSPNLYVVHTVAPKENFYSVGRLYNQTPKAIASFNNIAMEKGLAIGQKIKIPLNGQNLEEKGITNGGEKAIPLTHVVMKGETISKIAADYNTSAQSIKQWNTASDNIAPGTPLVVGHLKMSSASGVAKLKSAAQENNKPVAKQEAPVEPKQVATEVKQEEPTPIAKQQPAKTAATAPAATEAVAPAKETVVKQDVVKKPTEVSAKTEARKPETFSYASAGNSTSIEGVFANAFTIDTNQKSLNTKSGEAATFKSTSGWQDKKYYVLMNDVAPGTILKISSTENKVVYAKVLGSMPEMKENNGLIMRISNAAASYLGIIDPKFTVQVTYYQ